MMEWNEVGTELNVIDNNTLKVEVKPYEIKTLRVKPSTTVQGKLAQD